MSGVTVERLRVYLEENKVWIPRNASKEQLEAAVARHYLDGKKVDLKSCFGLWQNEDMNCMTCNYNVGCFKASFGVDRIEYDQQFKKHSKNRVKNGDSTSA